VICPKNEIYKIKHKAMELKQSIKKYLVDQGLYHESDDILLDEIDFNIELMTECKADIRENGIKINITRNEDKEDFFQKNRSVDVYQQALKNVQALFRQLVLTPSERQKLKLELAKKDDEFEKIFD